VVERLEIIGLNRHHEVDQPLLRFLRRLVVLAGDDGDSAKDDEELGACASGSNACGRADEVDSRRASSSLLML